MIFIFGNNVIDVDVEKTRAFYKSSFATTPKQDCRCEGCQNFDAAILQAPPSVLDFLKSLGIDPQKPCEVFGLFDEPDEDKTYLYGGWYHVVGRMIKREEDPQRLYKPEESFDVSVGFTDERGSMGFIKKGFPAPILELSVSMRLPWLL